MRFFLKKISKLFSRLFSKKSSAIDADGDHLSLAVDVVDWIIVNKEDLIRQGVIEISVVIGSALSDYISIRQQSGNYTEVSIDLQQKLRKGIAIVACNQDGEAVKVEIITSKEGLTKESIEAFNGKSVMRVKLETDNKADSIVHVSESISPDMIVESIKNMLK